jgi:hypothetical protein
VPCQPDSKLLCCMSAGPVSSRGTASLACIAVWLRHNMCVVQHPTFCLLLLLLIFALQLGCCRLCSPVHPQPQ